MCCRTGNKDKKGDHDDSLWCLCVSADGVRCLLALIAHMFMSQQSTEGVVTVLVKVLVCLEMQRWMCDHVISRTRLCCRPFVTIYCVLVSADTFVLQNSILGHSR